MAWVPILAIAMWLALGAQIAPANPNIFVLGSGEPGVRASWLELSAQPEPRGWERGLSQWSFSRLREARRLAIRVTRYLRRTIASWVNWVATGIALLLLGALASAADIRLLRVWRRHGGTQAAQQALIGIAVFLRLLRDRRLPQWPRVLLAAALLYGIAAHDFVSPPWRGLWWLDDVVVVTLAARWFVWRCPEALIVEHAQLLAQRIKRRRQMSSARGTT
jgi:uncharacterized membrane protein YkvA (DUF1232 family)